MNIQERIEALEIEFAEKIKALKAEAQQEKEFPQYAEDYWFVDSDAEVMGSVWYGDDFDCEQGRLSIGNVFKTKEQAEFVAEKLKVEAELRKFSRKFVAYQSDCFISYEHGMGELEFRYSSLADVQGAIYFESAEKAKQAIEEVGEERIKKYLFGVEG